MDQRCAKIFIQQVEGIRELFDSKGHLLKDVSKVEKISEPATPRDELLLMRSVVVFLRSRLARDEDGALRPDQNDRLFYLHATRGAAH
jgi:hypothetical protein